MLVQARNLRKTFRAGGLFRRGAGVLALDDVSFSLAEGEALGVVGESGSGKSTLLRTILRLTPYDAGSVTFDGAEIATMDRVALRRFRQRVQPVFQNPYSTFNPRFSVGASIALGFELLGDVEKADIPGEVARLLDDVGLDPDLARALPHQLSGGQRQRAAIARALAVKPDLLLLDEPTSALDVSVQAQVLNLFKDLQRRYGFSLMLVTHDLPVVTFMCDNVLVMKAGTIVERGETGTLVRDPESDYTRKLVSSAL